MKILDRYVLWSFLKNYLISFMVLIGMYVVLDMVFNFDELVEVRSTGTEAGAKPLLSVLMNVGGTTSSRGSCSSSTCRGSSRSWPRRSRSCGSAGSTS